MPVLVALGPFTDALIGMLQAAAPDEEFVALPTDGTDPPACDALLTSGAAAREPVDLERALASGVGWVHAFAAGVDGFPFERLGGRVLTCSRGASAPAIAEFVLATMLAFEKQLPQAWVHEPPEHWNIAGLGGLRGKTLGLVGLGAIGTAIAQRALAFEMRVVATRRTAAPSTIAGIEIVPALADLLAQSDHVVVAAPATSDTHHLVDAAALAYVKRGAHFVNISRGTLVDQDALLAALDDGRLAMASLDVVDPEPLPEGHVLYSHPKVRLSPHISWSAPDTIARTIDLFVENLARHRSGEPLAGVVDVEAGY